ncbi:MAG: DUF1080 domain-containing protein [Pirellulales bacterium]
MRNTLLIPLLLTVLVCGCSDKKTDERPKTSEDSTAKTTQPDPVVDNSKLDLTVGAGPVTLPDYEVDPKLMMASTLSSEQLNEGWVKLFDGHTLAGWSITGKADWQCKNGVIRVTQGEPSFLVTNFELADYELKVDFRCADKTNSGVFLRTAPEPGDVGLDCLELNIAPPDNPFPTGSFVKRQRLEPEKLGSFDPKEWHTYHIRLEGESVKVSLDGKPITEIADETSSRRGCISLQHNQGVVEFRNVLLRPIAPRSMKMTSGWEEDWVVGEKEPGVLKVASSGDGLHLQGGLGKVQSKSSFGDFWLQAKYTLAKPEVNTGIFFRCIEDSMLDGYECQVNHAIIDKNPLAPKDSGAGAIFRRKPARIVIGDGTKPTHISLLASGNQMFTWVNGILTAEFTDDRPADLNPRKGTRVEPGPIALQGHDPTTDATFHEIKVTTLR